MRCPKLQTPTDKRRLTPVELGEPFDRQIVRLGGSRSENDFLGFGPDQVRDLDAGLFNGLLALPAEYVGAAVRVSEEVGHVGEHGVENPEVHRGSGRIVEVQGFALFLAGCDVEVGKEAALDFA